MGLISCFIKTTVAILSITPSLSAHVLHTESITSRAATPDEHTGPNYQFEFQNAQGEPFSEKDAAGIKVFHYNHHHYSNNSAKTRHLQKRASRPIDHGYCQSPDDQFWMSICLPSRSPRAWGLQCSRPPVPGPEGPYFLSGACSDSEICINGQVLYDTAHCARLEDFVQLSLTRSRGDDQTFHHDVVNLPANAEVTLRATDSKTNADVNIAHLEMSAQHCGWPIGNINQCVSLQDAQCDYCKTEVLRLSTRGLGVNRITFLARFFRPGVNLYLGVVPSGI